MLAIGFLIFCIVVMIIMEYAPNWVYGAIITIFEKIMED